MKRMIKFYMKENINKSRNIPDSWTQRDQFSLQGIYKFSTNKIPNTDCWLSAQNPTLVMPQKKKGSGWI